MAGDQLPVLTLDIDESKIAALNEISEKFKAAFSIGPGGISINNVPQPSQTVKKEPAQAGEAEESRQRDDKGRFLPANNSSLTDQYRPEQSNPNPGAEGDKFLKNLGKTARGTLKTFGLINKTLGVTNLVLKKLFTTTVSWGARIAAIGGGGLFGYGYMAHRATEQYKSAQGLGVSTGEMQAANNVYGSRFSNTGNLLQALAAAQNDPNNPHYAGLRSLGINPQDGAAANLPKLLEGVSSLLKQYKGTGVSQAVLKGHGLDGVIDVATANQVLANSDRLPQLNQQFVAQSQRLDRDLGSGTQQSYQELSSRFAMNADRIGNTFLKTLARLNGPIGRVADNLTASIEKFLNGRNGQALFDSLANGLQKLGNWLGSDDFQRDLDSFSKAVKRIAQAIGSAIDWLSGYGIKAPTSVDEARGQSSFDVTRSKEELAKKGLTEKQAAEENASGAGFLRAMGNTVVSLLTGGNVTIDAAEERWKAGGWANHGGNKQPRGLRNNNPGNLNFVGQYGAKLEDGPNARFAQFPTMLDGIAALDKQVGLYLKRGTNTIDKIMDIYAPKSDKNDTAAYKSYLSRFTGLGIKEEIDPSNNEQIKRLIVGIINHENGPAASTISGDDVLKAMAMNRGAQALPGPASSHQAVKIEVVQQPGSDISAQVKGIYVTPR
ncbi:lytic transglycosylase domain-containing protein [Enterobacter sp. Lyrl_3]|uniref:lytic transglycosylase domain-containing protein n=1 Tax=Enterobacter sp. Lyrl_3 TaxID=3110922 RepID=UPI003F80226D